MNGHKALRKAQAARLLMEQTTIQEAFDDIEEDIKNELFSLAGDSPDVAMKFRELKSFTRLRERLEINANSEKHHKNEVESRENYNNRQGH